ncbi:hypothetical protein [Mycolicibacterium sp.]|uniref:hypothetical protein n=1 Tax=Mycolicibacterium sp. TaxID=2320850 RepID=UPI0037C552DA
MNIWFIALAFVGLLIPVFAPLRNQKVERRFFWIGFAVASVSAFFIAFPPDWKLGLGLSLLVVVLLLLRAYFSTSNIKVGDKVYAYRVTDSRPDPSPDKVGDTSPRSAKRRDPAPDSYGGIATARKSWWLLVVVAVICVVPVAVYLDNRAARSAWLPVALVGFIVVVGLLRGLDDSSWRYPIARGQLVQFVIVSIITVGVFAVVYLIGYAIGKRWPLRLKRSMEYRAHPRHWT